MIQLEVGKRYFNRLGEERGPLERTPTWSSFCETHPFLCKKSNETFRADGSYSPTDDGFETSEDLVAEHTEADYDHLGDLQREHNERQEKYAALSGMVADNQAMGMYDPPQPAIRTFASGATRNLDHNKLDYEGFNCPAAQRAFAEYMHTHRKQADGTMRDGDNWQKGIPIDQYMKSLVRHAHDLHLLHDGWVVKRSEDGVYLLPISANKIELLCAIWFNVQGMIHELLKEERNANQSS